MEICAESTKESVGHLGKRVCLCQGEDRAEQSHVWMTAEPLEGGSCLVREGEGGVGLLRAVRPSTARANTMEPSSPENA